MLLVTGATGNVGRKLVDFLVQSGEKIRAVSRRPETAALPQVVEVVKADLLRPETLGAALTGVDRIFALFHLPGDPKQAVNLANALARTSVKRIVMFSSATVQRVVKGDAIGEDYRRAEAELRATGKLVRFVRPGTLMFNSLGWADQLRSGDLVRGMEIAPAAIMDEADVARAAAVLLTMNSVPQENYQITGPDSLSAADQVGILGEVLNRKLNFEPIPATAAAQFISEHTQGAGDPYALMDNAMGPNVVWARPNGVYEALTGLKPRSYRQWAQAHIDAFR